VHAGRPEPRRAPTFAGPGMGLGIGTHGLGLPPAEYRPDALAPRTVRAPDLGAADPPAMPRKDLGAIGDGRQRTASSQLESSVCAFSPPRRARPR
jgi:hypothetical protein